MTLLRRRAMRKGIQSDNEFLRLLALVLIGRPALIRQGAYRRGIAGSSRVWRTVAIGIAAGDIWRKLVVKEPDRLGIERLAEGQGVTVLAMTRPSRRDRRRSARVS